MFSQCDIIERPEAVVDNRTLYERLKQQKDTKQEEWDDKHKFSKQKVILECC